MAALCQTHEPMDAIIRQYLRYCTQSPLPDVSVYRYIAIRRVARFYWYYEYHDAAAGRRTGFCRMAAAKIVAYKTV